MIALTTNYINIYKATGDVTVSFSSRRVCKKQRQLQIIAAWDGTTFIIISDKL